MKAQLHAKPSGALPINHDLTSAYRLSALIAILMTAASLGGLIFSSAIYQTEKQLVSFLANDLVNLLIGLPILLGCMWLTRRAKLVGLLCWPGALLYTFYNYIAYMFGMSFGLLTLIFTALVLLSAYAMFNLTRNIDWDIVKTQLEGAVSEKLSGWVLVFFGVAFFSLAVGIITAAMTDQAALPMTEIGVAIADITLSALVSTGGVLLIQRKPLGYAGGMGLLFAASMLFIGVILVVLLQPPLTNAPFALDDVIVLAGMGLISFIPTGLFMRGVVSKS